MKRVLAALALWCAGAVAACPQDLLQQLRRQALVQLNDNGAWSWFMVDPRVIVNEDQLISNADKKRHDELFRGERGVNGQWTFTPFTRNSAWDNLRPVIPSGNDRRTAVVWMRGGYTANHGEWYSSVVAAIIPPQS